MTKQAEDTWAPLAEAVRSATPETALAVHNRVARKVVDYLRDQALPAGVRPLSIAILRTTTAEVLANSIIASFAEHRFAADVSLGQLGNIAPEILNDDSFVYTGSFDVCVVLAQAEQVVPGLFDPSTVSEHDRSIDAFIGHVRHLAGRFSGLVVVCGFATPPFILAPHLAAQSPDSGRHAVARANRRLVQATATLPNVVLCDVESLVCKMGTQRFYSARDWMTSMQPFAAPAIPALGRQLAETYMLYKTTPVKCIVLDCDNTLWGGIIGEDGITGIKLGESYPGLCYQLFQHQLNELNQLGFLLALNSKNNEDDVNQVFEKHPAMVLKREQIAAVRVNWRDKATNMRELAADLNIGLDSFVFIDDSEFEITLIREQLPEVRCFMVPKQPWALPGLLPGSRVIDRLTVTAEDRKKAGMYAEERKRKEYRQESGSLEDYLRGLEIQMKFEPFDAEIHLARTAQLTQKTNQYNLTTRRYTEADILDLANGGASVFLASLSDRFGEHGRIALAVVKPAAAEPKTCRLDVFLLSCRVIGRGVEDSFLRLVMGEMRRAGFEKFEAEFIPTAKNVVCQGFLAKNNLTETSRSDDGRVCYEHDLTEELAGVNDWITLC